MQATINTPIYCLCGLTARTQVRKSAPKHSATAEQDYIAQIMATHHYSPLTTYYSLLTTYYLLLTTHYSLLTTCYLLLTTYYLLLTTYYLLLTY